MDTVLPKTVQHDTKGSIASTQEIGCDPPSYNAAIESSLPDITAAFSNLTFTSKKHPGIDECIAHLKLLAAIHEIREQIGSRDGLYGLWDSFATSFALADDRKRVLSKIREKRWSIYVVQAVRRFEQWFQHVDYSKGMISIHQMESKWYSNIGENVTPLHFDTTDLPPIDVLMVWHTFLLNPRDFFSDCIRHNKMALWRSGLPWKAIVASIDNYSFEYDPGEAARVSFANLTDFPWESADSPSSIPVSCAACGKGLIAPLTTCDRSQSWKNLSRAGEYGKGYADADFTIRCDCSCVMNHKVLRGHRFRDDVQNLLDSRVPMPGTLLNMRGYTGQAIEALSRFDNAETSCYLTGFPNRLLRQGLGYKIALKAHSWSPLQAKLQSAMTVSDIRKEIEDAVKAAKQFASIRREERVAVRRMLACYWDNASIFSLDLVGAVIRQGIFVQKMHHIDWLHSPALHATMERLIEKYKRFINIMAKFPKKTAVPTLDVDLAWHTHQLNPSDYLAFGIKHTGKFINHDDKIDENVLSQSFEWTSKTYERMYGSIYAECTCWYCEAVREAHRPSMSALFLHQSVRKEMDGLHASQPTDPLRSAHISAHSAIKAEVDSNTSLRHAILKQRLERKYQKAVHRAKKERREPPSRETQYTAWGYDYPLVFYAPYMGDPCLTSGLYPAQPGCASYVAGAEGNCCAGTCGGPVASGGCSTGGCSGGSCSGGDSGGCGGCGGCG